MSKESIGDRARRRREALGVSQEQLAARLDGVSQQALSALESNKTRRPGYILTLARALRVSPGWLETGSGPMEPEPRPGGRLMAASQEALDLPVYATIERAEGGMLLRPEPTRWTRRPPMLLGVGNIGFAVEMIGDEMDEVVREGDIVVVHPQLAPAKGHLCLLLKGEPTGPTEILVRRLVDRSAETWKVRRYDQDAPEDVSRAEWPLAMRIVATYHR